jgi:hypothetical protein
MVAAMIGATGVGVMLVTVLLDPKIYHPAILAAAGGGALVGGLIFAGWFGRRGRFGWPIAVLGALLATAAGGAFGGAGLALADPHIDALSGLMIGAIYGPLVAFYGPAQALFWVAAFAGIHLVARRMRDRAPHAIASGTGEGFTP